MWKKGIDAFYACKKMFGRNWGYNSILVLYCNNPCNQMARPSLVGSNQQRVNRKQQIKGLKLAPLETAGVVKTTSQVNLPALD